MENTEKTMKELSRIEEALKKAEELRQQALTKKDIYENQLKETEEELKALGTTSKEGEAKLQKNDEEIKEAMAKIETMIPFELLKKYKLISE